MIVSSHLFFRLGARGRDLGVNLVQKIDVHITPGTHASEEAVNKQLADKERVAAALENSSLLEVVNQCLSTRTI
uniref:Cytosolic iron-sulfur assembly component 2B n=1 Tax=Acanthochromis polyacanthus TaxID=80966 RepID=A0A3Q1F8F3_9TELE